MSDNGFPGQVKTKDGWIWPKDISQASQDRVGAAGLDGVFGDDELRALLAAGGGQGGQPGPSAMKAPPLISLAPGRRKRRPLPGQVPDWASKYDPAVARRAMME